MIYALTFVLVLAVYILIGLISIKPICIREIRCGYKFSNEDFNLFIPCLIIMIWPIMWLMRPLSNYMYKSTKRRRDYELWAQNPVDPL